MPGKTVSKHVRLLVQQWECFFKQGSAVCCSLAVVACVDCHLRCGINILMNLMLVIIYLASNIGFCAGIWLCIYS